MRYPPRPGTRLALLFVLTLFTGVPLGGAHAAESVTLVLNGPPSGLQAGVIYAQRKGFYTQADVLLTIEPGKGSGHTVRSLAKREKALGLGELAAVIEARSEGVDTLGVALLMERFPATVIALEDSGIRTPANLEGRRLAAPTSSFARILFPYFAQKAGLDLERIRWSQIRPASGIRFLLEGRADAVVSSEAVRWLYQRAAARRHKAIVTFPYAAEGLEVYGLSLVAPLRLLEQEEDLVRRMVSATVRGVAEAMMQPVEALDQFRRSFPGRPAKGAEAEWRVFLASWSPQGLASPGLGFYREKRVRRLQALLLRGRQLPKQSPPDSFFTNRFVPKVAVRRVPF